MDTRKFVENIKKENSQNIKWITFGILSIVTSFYSATEFDYLFLAEPIALIVFASVSYYEKYLYLSEFGRTSGKPDTANLLSLTVLTKYHAFDVKQYFKILRRRFYVFQGIGVLCQMIWILLDGAVAASLIMAAAYVVVPMVVGMIIVYSEEDKQKTYQDTGAIVIVGFFKVIVEIFEVVLAAVSSILFLLLIVGVCGNGRIINALPKEQVVRIEDGGDVMMFAAIILMVLFLGTCLFTRLPVFLSKRNIKRIRIILGCLVVAVMTVYLLYSGCHYIRMEDGKFTIVSWGSRSEYTYDEISSLRLYNADDSL
ncbi:MAG: hypothetical protein IJ567_02505 [Lachnospiraceae bacterium]|nr:hypothetical protein [Lachnospiraceae bacterium]